jgi:hypothetical protein
MIATRAAWVRVAMPCQSGKGGDAMARSRHHARSVGVWIDDRLWLVLSREAVERQVSLSAILREALEQYAQRLPQESAGRH